MKTGLQDVFGTNGVGYVACAWSRLVMANVAWCRPYSFMRLFPHSLHPPLSTPSVCGMRECGSKKRKDDILAVVVDLHRAVVFGTAWKAAPKDSRLKRTDGEIAAHNAHTFSSLVRRNLISYGWNTPPPPRRAGQVNAPAPHIHFCSNCNLQRKIKAQLTWFQNRFMVATWLWLILIWEKQLQRWVPVVCSRKEGREGKRGWREWINNWAPPQRHSGLWLSYFNRYS